MLRTILSSFLLGLILAAGAAFAEPPAVSDIHDEAALLAQGWQRITDGVLQRKLGGNKAETFAFGREGAAWMVERSEDRLGFLLGEYEKYPSDRLRKVILDLRQSIAEMKKGLEISSLAAADMLGAGSLENCDIAYGAHADAYPLYPGPGVGASASSYFRNNCYHWGIADASVYVRATEGGVTTGDTAAQTQEGESVSASAALTRNGVEDCYSTAWARVQSFGLGILYETSDYNDDCPAPTLAVDITGPEIVSIFGYNSRILTWYATVTGGVPPYRIVWYRGKLGGGGTGDTYSDIFQGNNTTWTQYVKLSAEVTDSMGATAYDTHITTINYYAGKTCPTYEESVQGLTGEQEEMIICPY